MTENIPSPGTERSAECAATVTEADTAASFGPEFPPAASTPFVLGLAEVACHRAVAGDLADGEVTVGTRATIEHLVPSPVGACLRASSRLLGREGRALHFAVDVFDEDRLCARLTHDRALVPAGRIAARLAMRPTE